MSCCRAFLVSALVSISCVWAGAYADDKPLNETLIDLLQNKQEFKIAWSMMFKGEYSPPLWIAKLDANSTPAAETSINGKTYVFGTMCRASDCAADRVLALFSSDHKKCWAVIVTVPAGLGQDSVLHPKKYANMRYFGDPDQTIKQNLMMQLDKMFPDTPASAPQATGTPANATPANSSQASAIAATQVPGASTPDSRTTSAAASTPGDFSPQNDEAARKFRGELHSKKGGEMMKAHNYRQAEAEFKEAVRNDPDNIQYLEGYAEATSKANDYKEAIEAYGRLLKADPVHHTEAHAIIADSLHKLLRRDEAVEEYKKAIPFEKEKGGIWHKIAEIRLGQAKVPEAMDAYRNAMKAAPGDGKAYRLLAAMEWNQGNKAEALKTYRSGAQNAPRDGDLQAAYAYALMSEQRWQEAATAYKAAAMVKGSNPDLEAGYKSAMEHMNYDEQMAKQAAQAAAKKKKKR